MASPSCSSSCAMLFVERETMPDDAVRQAGRDPVWMEVSTATVRRCASWTRHSISDTHTSLLCRVDRVHMK